ncbi:MAG: hypothetical protein EXR32_08940 [Betaproteobacteria bacterium]|nr:hypothetical protein [Betaproteobacteria bacterium]
MWVIYLEMGLALGLLILIVCWTWPRRKAAMSATAASATLRARAHPLFTREEGGWGGQTIRAGLVLLIVISVATAVLKSVPQIGRSHGELLNLILLLTTLGFAIEYLLRLWIAPENPGATGAARERWRYVLSLPGLVDLVAAMPFVLAPQVGLNLDWLEIVPIFKLLRHTAVFTEAVRRRGQGTTQRW